MIILFNKINNKLMSVSSSSSDENKDNKSIFTVSDSSSSNKEISNPYINNEQILVDWINTIRQPHCLLVSSLTDENIIENGIVFVEIISNFLKNFGLDELNFNEHLNKYEKLNLIIFSLLELNKGKYFNYEMKQKTMYFYNKIKLIFQDKKILIEFLEFLKEIYEKYGIGNNNDNINYKNIKNPENLKSNNLKQLEDNDMNVFQDLNYKNEKKLISERIQNNSMNNKITNLNIHLYKKNNENKPIIHQSFDNTIHTQIRKNNQINKLYDNLLYRSNSNKEDSINSFSSQMNFDSKKNVLYHKIFPSHRVERNTNYNKLYYPSLSPTHNISISISPSNLNNTNKSTTNSNANNIQLNKYKANQGEINLTVGIIKRNLYNNINNDKNVIPIYHFLFPTKPILGVSTEIKIYEKYLTKVNKNFKLNNESIFQPEPILQTPIKEERKNKKIKKLLSEDIQNVIKKWLISLKIISRNVSFDVILNLCYNGILFCEIMNRYNSLKGNPIIKGIIKDPFTNPQSEINLRKFFQSINIKSKLYLKLKNYEELIQQLINRNEEIAIKILNDLYTYYNKNTQKYIQTEKNKIPINLYIEKNKYEENIPLSNRENKSIHNLLNLSNNNNTFTNDINSKSQNINNKVYMNNNNDKNNKKNNNNSNNNMDNKDKNNKSYNNNILSQFLNSRNYSQDFKKIDIYLNQDEDNNNDSLNHFFDIATLNNDYSKNHQSYVFNNLMKRNHNLLSKHSQINLKKGFLFNKSRKSQNTFNKKINSQSYNLNKVTPTSPKCFLLFNGSNINMMKDETKKFLNY